MTSYNISDMLRQVTRMRKDIDKVQEDLRERYVEAEAGDGLVEVTVSGRQELARISLSPKLFEPGKDGSIDASIIEDLILAAVKKGVDKSRALMREEMEKATGDAGMGGLLSGLFPG